MRPHIHTLINSKMGIRTYLLDREHLPLRPDFEDNEVVMDASHPTCAEAQEKIERAKAAKAPNAASAPDASVANHKTKKYQLSYLLEATVGIEKSLATLTQNQESLDRIIETKFHDLDVKVTEIETVVEKLPEDAEDKEDVMDASHPTCAEAQEKREKAKAAKVAKAASALDASTMMLKSKQDELSYLLEARVRIEKGLATLTQNQGST